MALEVMLNVLPPPRAKTGSAAGAIADASADCEALEKLRQLVFSKEIPQPEQIKLNLEFGS